MNLEEAKKYFSNDKYATKTSGIEILEVDGDYVKTCMKIDERHNNAVGGVMGGAIFTLADFTFAVATNSPEKVTVSVSGQVNFLNSTKGTVLYGESRKIKDGKRTCFYEILIKDNLDENIATVSFCGMHLK